MAQTVARLGSTMARRSSMDRLPQLLSKTVAPPKPPTQQAADSEEAAGSTENTRLQQTNRGRIPATMLQKVMGTTTTAPATISALHGQTTIISI